MEVVSIVMPVYNAEKFLHQSLSSVEQQTYKNWQLIAVDDCSSDCSLQLLQNFHDKYPQQTIITQSAASRSGASVCRNIGLQKAKGGYIIFFDSDDLLEPFCLAQRVNVMQADTSLDWAVFNQYQWYPSKQPPYTFYNKPIKNREDAVESFLKMDSAWQTMAVIWKRKSLELLNGFDELLYFMEDPDLHLRALLTIDLKVAFKTDLPADSFYKMPEINENNADSFYNNGIKSRFAILNKLLEFLPEIVSESKLSAYYGLIRFGFFDFIKVFMLKRFKSFEKEFDETVNMLNNKKVLRSIDNFKLNLIKKIFTSDSKLIAIFKIKGLAHRFLFNQ